MNKFSHDIIVIGGGAAGLTVTSGCSQLGLKTLLIEKEKMGGDCLYYGCVPSKTLLKTAKIYENTKHFEKYGLPKISPPKIEIQSVLKRVHSVIEKISYNDSPERFIKLGAEIIFGNAQFKSSNEINVDEQTFSAPKIVIASGSQTFIPLIPGLNETGYITNKEIFSLKKLPKSLITIGGGPIGIELSQALARLGVDITILNAAPQILVNEDPDMARIVEMQLINEGIKIHNNVNISKIDKNQNSKKITTESKIYLADEILLATGRSGNIENLNLEKAGIYHTTKFIPADKQLKTNIKHIYSIGDINGKYLFTHVAGAEGSFVVKNAALKVPSKFSYSSIPWCIYTEPELASIGLNEKRAKEQGIKYDVIESFLDDIDRAHTEGQIQGKMKVLINKKERVIGTQITGLNAGDLILPSLFAVTKKYKLLDIMSPIYPYPTLGEIQKKAGASYYGPKLFNNKVRKILKFLYKYRG